MKEYLVNNPRFKEITQIKRNKEKKIHTALPSSRGAARNSGISQWVYNEIHSRT